jgi:hypothetical protein
MGIVRRAGTRHSAPLGGCSMMINMPATAIAAPAASHQVSLTPSTT